MSDLNDLPKSKITITFDCPISNINDTFEIENPDIEIKDNDWYLATKPGIPDIDDPSSVIIAKTVGEIVQTLFDRWGVL